MSTIIISLFLILLADEVFSSSELLWAAIPPSASTTPAETGENAGRANTIDNRVANADEIGLLLMGNSITHYWENSSTYSDLTQGRNEMNQAITGDVTPGMLYRILEMDHLNFNEGVEPKVGMFLIGTNNLHRNMVGLEGRNSDPQEVADGIRAIVQIYARRVPTMRIINLAILPTDWHQGWLPVNEITKDYYDDRQVYTLNLQELFLNGDGSLKKSSLMPDGIHPNDAGYQLWVDDINPMIEELMNAEPLDHIKIMPIGGSITEGVSSATSYRRYLDGMIRRQGHLIDVIGSRNLHNDNSDPAVSYEYDLDHEGHWNRNSHWLATNIPSRFTSYVPDVAVIHMGTRDIVEGTGNTDALTEAVVTNTGTVISALRTANPGVKIALAKIIPITGSEEAVNMLNLKISRYIAANTTAASPIMVADQHTGFGTATDLESDGVMPNASGAQKMATVFAGVINNMLSGTGCMDRAFLEFDPSATGEDASLCKTSLASGIDREISRENHLKFLQTAPMTRIYNLAGERAGEVYDFTGSSTPGGVSRLAKKFKLKAGVYFIQRANQPAKKVFLTIE